MSVYGMLVKDASGNAMMLTPKLSKVVAGGVLTMSDSLEGDGTYGEDVSLSPLTNVPVADIGVIVQPTVYTYKATIASWTEDSFASYPFSWLARDGITYYTKASTGVMSSWSAGDMHTDDATTWDAMNCCFPLGGWDYVAGTITFSTIRIWAAMAYIVYDNSASAFKTVYTIGSSGVSEVNYMIFIKNH